MFNRFSLLILLAFLIFILPACSTDQPAARKVPEILLGTDCGFDRLKCCSTTPICSYNEQCCADPNDSSRNYCDNNCDCGANEEFCCAGNQCRGNTVCVAGLCAACGGQGEPCCSGGAGCSAGSVCQNDKCAECGINGGPCCPGSNCLPKTGERSECLDNICAVCGFGGNPACTTGAECLPGQILTGKTCERCGQANQPCCDADSGMNYDCDPAAGLKCQLGFCAKGN